MPIDIANETHLPIKHAPKHIPGRPDISTVYRWMLRRHNPLESFRVGGRTFTTLEAIGRIIAACNESECVVIRQTRAREAARNRAARELDAAGI